ncbi:MAG: response regulator transcription factor [Oscillatoriales cyanobacterium SM2_1_8]|nr:response regulator transcription factor [Oscillatoriales cyanobacterium SM2_1_8]
MKLLLVEDDRALGSLVATYLQSHHYAVDIATDGETALALARTYPYDLILLDLALPKLDGLSVCRQLRAERRTVPIAILTQRDRWTIGWRVWRRGRTIIWASLFICRNCWRGCGPSCGAVKPWCPKFCSGSGCR